MGGDERTVVALSISSVQPVTVHIMSADAHNPSMLHLTEVKAPFLFDDMTGQRLVLPHGLVGYLPWS